MAVEVHVNLADDVAANPVTASGEAAGAVAADDGAGGARLDADTVRGLAAHAVRATLGANDVDTAEISLTFLDDPAITRLNAEHLERTGPTDVISFALHNADEPPLGDVYVGYDQALRQAAELDVPPTEELARLAVHGTLHVLGRDHPEGAGRTESAMWREQERILKRALARWQP